MSYPLICKFALEQNQRKAVARRIYDAKSETTCVISPRGDEILNTGSLMTRADLDPTSDESTDR